MTEKEKYLLELAKYPINEESSADLEMEKLASTLIIILKQKSPYFEKKLPKEELEAKTIFLDVKNKILDIVIKMLENDNRDFAEVFLLKAAKSRYNLYYKKNNYGYTPHISAIFPLYLCADLYNYYKNDLEKYKELINSIEYQEFDDIEIKLALYELYKLIPVFPKSPSSREYLKKILGEKLTEKDYYLLIDKIEYLKRVSNYLEREGINPNRLNINTIFEMGYPLHGLAPFLDDRFYYVKEKLDEIEDNPKIKDKIFYSIAGWNILFFEEAERETGIDAFKLCIDRCFNSETYKELFRKLEKVKEFSICKGDWDFRDSCNSISNIFTNFFDTLTTRDYQEEFKGNKSTSTTVIKSKKIIDRMGFIYGWEYGFHLFNDFNRWIEDGNISDLYKKIEEKVNEYNKKPILKVKRYIDTKIKK